MRAGIIGILCRTYGPDTCARELEAVLACRDQLVAVDLAGDEAAYPPELFTEHFRRVRDAGLHVTIHAGEAAGPESVWSAIRDLGAERIGHGFRSIEDPALVDYLADRRIGLECCPTSNLHIQEVKAYAEHPIRELAARGVKFCLNTDDPGISNITLAHEYDVAAPAVGLSEAQIRQSQRDALDMAFLSRGEKEKLREAAGRRSAVA
ncbi:MAG: adenosine deaminase [Gammaproteobacteria bacterium]